jgi:hypothetical protein
LIFSILFVLPYTTAAFTLSDIQTINQGYSLAMSDQSFCIADDTSTILEHNTDTLRFPASVSKLYVTDWVLNTLPKDFRFKTQFVQKGSTVAECLAKHFPVPMEFVGVDDKFGQSGTPDELIEHYGMGVESIKKAVKNVLARKGR